jgi:hypothetical protein
MTPTRIRLVFEFIAEELTYGLKWRWPDPTVGWSYEAYDEIEFPTLEEARSEYARAVVERTS